MRQNNLTLLTIGLFVLLIGVMTAPFIMPALGVAGNTTIFNVTVTINSGSPSIIYVYPISDSPNEGATKVLHFYFNATHPNGVANIPNTNAHIKINRSGIVLNDSGCVISSTDSISTNMYDCSVTINYYHLPGAWTINATITDLASNGATNTTEYYTNGNVYGIVLASGNIAFAGSPGQLRPSNPAPQYVNNTGNNAYGYINLTAYEVRSGGANSIGTGNFTANTTDGSGAGHTLLNNTAVTLANSALAVSGSDNVYLYLNIPNGISNGTYTSTSQWTITVK